MCERRWPRAEDLVLVCASERVIRGLVVGLALLLQLGEMLLLELGRILFGEANILSTMTASAAFVI